MDISIDKDSKGAGRWGDLAQRAAVFAFFAAIGFSLTLPLFDPDFWWHLASGRWMVQNGQLLQEDPFNFLQFPDEPAPWRSFILKQYWLSQVIFYATYKAAGFIGLVALRALVHTAMFYGAYHLMRRAGGGRAVSIALVLLSYMVIVREIGYVATRPQMFTSMLFVFTLLVLERLRQGELWARYALPVMMLVWANLHGGYVIGVVTIGVYLFASVLMRSGRRDMYISCAVAILAAMANPNGYGAVLSLLESLTNPGAASYVGSVVEQKSVFSYGGVAGVARRMPAFASLIAISAASYVLAAIRFRRIRVEMLLLYLITLVMAYGSTRYIIFFCMASIIATMNSISWVAEAIKERAGSRSAYKAVALVISVMLILGMCIVPATDGYARTAFRLDKPYVDDMGGAVEFIRSNGLTGRVYNDYTQGGYLIWQLYPGSQVFMDGRGLYHEGFDLGRMVLDNPYLLTPGTENMPLYQSVTEKYGIDLAVLPGCDKVSGVLIRLALALAQDPTWYVVYSDNEAIVFMRFTPRTRAFIMDHGLPDRRAYENILHMATEAGHGPYADVMSGRKFAMAVGYAGTGNFIESLRWLEQYVRQAPNDQYAQAMYNDLKMRAGAR